MTDPEPRAVEHTDNLPPSSPCDTCGFPRELIMLERFTGWWCRECATARAS